MDPNMFDGLGCFLTTLLVIAMIIGAIIGALIF